MEKALKCGARFGTVSAPTSKSVLHRALVCAALGKKSVKIKCDAPSDDVFATADCLNSLCADISYENGIITVLPHKKDTDNLTLFVKESATTLRFIMALCGAFGKSAVIVCENNLAERPLSPFGELLSSKGMNISKNGNRLTVSGKLKSGDYAIAGDISSQFVSALLFSLPLLEGESRLAVTGELKSKPYVKLTEDMLSLSGIDFGFENNKYTIKGNQKYSLPDSFYAEGDYSSAAPFLCMGAKSCNGITVTGFSPESRQGDRKITDILKSFGADVTVGKDFVTVKESKLCGITADAENIPDLVPVIAALGCVAGGKTVINNVSRLKYKETDRIKTTVSMLYSLGGDIMALGDEIVINGKASLKGGRCSSYGDHRIAMAAAVAASFCETDVIIDDVKCTAKSYINFVRDFEALEVQGF